MILGKIILQFGDVIFFFFKRVMYHNPILISTQGRVSYLIRYGIFFSV